MECPVWPVSSMVVRSKASRVTVSVWGQSPSGRGAEAGGHRGLAHRARHRLRRAVGGHRRHLGQGLLRPGLAPVDDGLRAQGHLALLVDHHVLQPGLPLRLAGIGAVAEVERGLAHAVAAGQEADGGRRRHVGRAHDEGEQGLFHRVDGGRRRRRRGTDQPRRRRRQGRVEGALVARAVAEQGRAEDAGDQAQGQEQGEDGAGAGAGTGRGWRRRGAERLRRGGGRGKGLVGVELDGGKRPRLTRPPPPAGARPRVGIPARNAGSGPGRGGRVMVHPSSMGHDARSVPTGPNP